MVVLPCSSLGRGALLSFPHPLLPSLPNSTNEPTSICSIAASAGARGIHMELEIIVSKGFKRCSTGSYQSLE